MKTTCSEEFPHPGDIFQRRPWRAPNLADYESFRKSAKFENLIDFSTLVPFKPSRQSRIAHMPANIEIKAHVRDLGELRRRSEALSDTPVQLIPQEDTFFHSTKGRLKLRQLGPDLAQLVYYERPDQEGPKCSNYTIFETRDPEGLKTVLSQALGQRGIVRKKRYLYLAGQTRIHLDDVEGLGLFMELEVVLHEGQSEAEGRSIAVDLMNRLGVRQEDLLDGAYIDILEKKTE